MSRVENSSGSHPSSPESPKFYENLKSFAKQSSHTFDARESWALFMTGKKTSRDRSSITGG